MRQTIAIYPFKNDPQKLEANIWIPRTAHIEAKRIRRLVPANVYAHLKTEQQRLKAANSWAVAEILRLQNEARKVKALTEAQPLTVHEFCSKWLDRLRAQSESEEFVANTELVYSTHIKDELGSLTFAQLTQEVCDRFVGGLKKKSPRTNTGKFKRAEYERMKRNGHTLEQIAATFGMSRPCLLRAITRTNKPATNTMRRLKVSTQRNIISTLGSLLRCAYEYGELKQKPKLLYPRMVIGKVDREKYYTAEQFAIMLDEATKLGLALFELLGADAGLRRCEILAVMREDYDAKSRTLSVVRQITTSGRFKLPKGEKRRTIKATPRLHAAIIASGISKAGSFR